MEKLDTIQKREKLNDVYPIGEAGPGGAYHDYAIVNAATQEILTGIEFQRGPRKEQGSRHGVIDSDLLEIVRYRLKAFQAGPYACIENKIALNHVEEALHWMNKRVEDRIERNVLGTMKK